MHFLRTSWKSSNILQYPQIQINIAGKNWKTYVPIKENGAQPNSDVHMLLGSPAHFVRKDQRSDTLTDREMDPR